MGCQFVSKIPLPFASFTFPSLWILFSICSNSFPLKYLGNWLGTYDSETLVGWFRHFSDGICLDSNMHDVSLVNGESFCKWQLLQLQGSFFVLSFELGYYLKKYYSCDKKRLLMSRSIYSCFNTWVTTRLILGSFVWSLQ